MQAALVAGSAAYGAYAQQKAATAQRRLANRNADLLDKQAEDALARGEQEVRSVRRQTRALIARQQTRAAASGLDLSSGAPADLVNESLAMGAADEAQARTNAFNEAWGIRGQSSNQRLAGRYAYRAGSNQAIGTVLGALGDSARTYYQYDRPTVEGGT